MKTWLKKTINLPHGQIGKICIYVPKDKSAWLNHGLEFWLGNLKGLTKVASSPAAKVYLGKVADDSGKYYFKKCLMRNTKDRFKHLFRASRGRRAVMGDELLRNCDHNAPISVCLIEEKKFGITVCSGVITKAIQNAQTAGDLLGHIPSTTEQIHAKLNLVKAIGNEVGALHASGIYHGDMRSGNILCQTGKNGWIFYWLDNESTRKLPSLRAQARNIAQANMTRIGISMTDRLRFWNAYVAGAHYNDSYANRLLRESLKRTKKRWNKRGWSWGLNR